MGVEDENKRKEQTMSKELNCMNCSIGDFKHGLCDCNNGFCKEFKSIGKQEDFFNAVMQRIRPQGEWIRTGRTNIYGGIEVQCSNCGDKVMVQHLEDEWYCRHCGADMGMKGADDE